MFMDAVGLGDLDVGEPCPPRSSRYSRSVRAPAMQPVHCVMSARVASSMSSSATTSLTANRPPGRRTRPTSRSTAALSVDRLMTQLEITTSTAASGSGMDSMWPLRNSTFVDAGFGGVAAGEVEHLVGHVQPVGHARGRPGGPTGSRRCRRRSRGPTRRRRRRGRRRRSGCRSPGTPARRWPGGRRGLQCRSGTHRTRAVRPVCSRSLLRGVSWQARRSARRTISVVWSSVMCGLHRRRLVTRVHRLARVSRRGCCAAGRGAPARSCS